MMFPWESQIYTTYGGTGTGNAIYSGLTGSAGARGPSNALWSQIYEGNPDPTGLAGSIYVEDDFLAHGGAAANTDDVSVVSDAGAWKTWTANVTASDIYASYALPGGVIIFNIPVTNGNTVQEYMALGSSTLAATGTAGIPIAYVDDSAGKKLIFETRVKLLTDVANGASFWGFSNVPIDTGALVVDTGVPLGTADFLGFKNIAGRLEFGWQKASAVAMGTVGAAAAPALTTTLVSTGTTEWYKTMVADTWYKLGFVYNPRSSASRRIVAYVDGSEVGTASAAHLGLWNAAHTAYTGSVNFPHQTYLSLVLLARGIVSAAETIKCDWVRAYQEG